MSEFLLRKLKMTAATVITERISDVFSEMSFCTLLKKLTPLALTPTERWEAAKGFNSNFIVAHWFILIAVAVLAILTVLLVWVSYNQVVKGRKAAEQLFVEHAERRGLSARERQILFEIAGRSGLKRNDAIFTTVDAFDRAATKLMEENKAEGNKQLVTDLSVLREKLGFKKQAPRSIKSKPSSRHIPVGKTLHITRRTSRAAGNIEAIVIENNDTELTVKLKTRAKVTFGEIWRARYYFGASVWEFDTSVMSYDGDVLVLNHSDKVRFINRRRFVRVPVKNLAFISRFPFTRTLPADSVDSEVAQDMAKAFNYDWKPLEFVHAVVTELAGPGLRIEAPLKVKAGERILVVFRLDEKGNHENGEAAISRIVESIAVVRHTEAVKKGFSIAIELIGLEDSDISELVRVTNAASLRAGAGGQEDSNSISNKQKEKRSVAKSSAV